MANGTAAAAAVPESWGSVSIPSGTCLRVCPKVPAAGRSSECGSFMSCPSHGAVGSVRDAGRHYPAQGVPCARISPRHGPTSRHDGGALLTSPVAWGAVTPVIAPDEGRAPAATDAIVQGSFPLVDVTSALYALTRAYAGVSDRSKERSHTD